MITSKGFGFFDGVDIVAGVLPDRFVFVDGKLNTWDNVLSEVNKGEIKFSSIKVSVRLFSSLIKEMKEYEQDNT